MQCIADIRIKKVLEGTSRIVSGSLHAKMINGQSVSVKSDSADIEAMYAEHSEIHCDHSATISLMKGTTKAYL